MATDKLDHWVEPRKTIATKYQDNDLGYATHGAIQAMIFLQKLNIKPQEFADKTLLDYGCGTGRIGRILSPLFKSVYCYDPVEECIIEGRKELDKIEMPLRNILLTTNLNEVPECDYGISVNVIEHLVEADQNIMLCNLTEKIKEHCVLWYSVPKNKTIIPFLTFNQQQLDLGMQIQVRAIKFRE